MKSEAGLVKTQWMKRASQLRAAFVALGSEVLDRAFPPVCLVCSDAVATPDGLCPQCWRQLVPISTPLCPRLGLPFATDMGEGAWSVQAIANPPPFERGRSAVAYTDLARKLVSMMKYSDRPEIALFCGRMMAAAGHELLGPDAVLVPVPLHRGRQLSRRYNQAAELARAIARVAKTPVSTDLIVRHRPTVQQVGLNAGQRARNVEGAFRADARRVAQLREKRVVLVDDVLTTGATVSAAVKVLKRAGAGHVDVLSFARVVFDADMTV
ncbi:MAG TPA: ComF family protein [Pelagibacterium sp.]|uniref:ComF family protein n=1 Tax=Pelagibacterium sp. TaxID=1967288 RepID=UPI002C5F3B12|nr:ComF family protein [Pelagibacterium sp.]HWJ87484.1 ComF family protein [Pelagibacterium sp.]